MITAQEQLNYFTQTRLDRYGWYGFLLEIANTLPNDSNQKAIILSAIAEIEPQPSIKEAIAKYGLGKILVSALENAQETGYNLKPEPAFEAKLKVIINWIN